jgi:hypothetical protein
MMAGECRLIELQGCDVARFQLELYGARPDRTFINTALFRCDSIIDKYSILKHKKLRSFSPPAKYTD